MKRPKSAPLPIPDQYVPTLRRGGYALCKVSRKILKVFEAGIDEAELEKGRRLARRGTVIRYQIKAGMISAELDPDNGNASSIRVVVRCPTLPESYQKAFISLAATTAASTGALLNNEIHSSLLDPIDDVNLVPRKGEVESICSICKDKPACRHIGAVHALLVDFLNENELLMLRWRGFYPSPESDTGDYPADTSSVLDAIREARGWPLIAGKEIPTGSAAPAWNRLPNLAPLPTPSEQEEAPVIEQLGLPPFFPESERNLLTTLRRLQEDA